MSFLSRLRIGQRLTLSYALLILLLVVIGAFGAHNASRLSNDLTTTANSSLVKISLANALESDVNVIARASRDLLLLDTANAIKRQKEDIAKALTTAPSSWRTWRARFPTPRTRTRSPRCASSRPSSWTRSPSS
ncbi:four helix bundle sensory module for signal transduction domain-containing protein [Ditylenchus destructor]|nr:four helix bundle sensory module for signal transduction domain-containing protein [Ditylenchus destructor]